MIAPNPNNLGEKQNATKLSSQNLPRGYLSRDDDEDDDQIDEEYNAKKKFH